MLPLITHVIEVFVKNLKILHYFLLSDVKNSKMYYIYKINDKKRDDLSQTNALLTKMGQNYETS